MLENSVEYVANILCKNKTFIVFVISMKGEILKFHMILSQLQIDVLRITNLRSKKFMVSIQCYHRKSLIRHLNIHISDSCSTSILGRNNCTSMLIVQYKYFTTAFLLPPCQTAVRQSNAASKARCSIQ